jgi:hypothetical protein
MTRINSILIPPISNAPFTATVFTEWTTYQDGIPRTIKNHRTVARDSNGRLFEERRFFATDGDQRETGLTQLEFTDPTAHQKYICNPSSRVCELRGYFVAKNLVATSTVASNRGLGTEDLGQKTIEGLDAFGSREGTTIPAGTIGNDHPLAVANEFWFSPQLGINLVVNRTDPRSGSQKFRVGNIVLGEPDSKLFEPPSDYKVVDLRNSNQ